MCVVGCQLIECLISSLFSYWLILSFAQVFLLSCVLPSFLLFGIFTGFYYKYVIHLDFVNVLLTFTSSLKSCYH